MRVDNWLVMSPVGLQQQKRERERKQQVDQAVLEKREGEEGKQKGVSLDLRVCGNWPAMRSQQQR